MKELPSLTIYLRHALPQVYGPHAVTGIMPRAVCAAAYTKLDEKMQFLWDSSMRLNTVRVRAFLPPPLPLSRHMVFLCRYTFGTS